MSPVSAPPASPRRLAWVVLVASGVSVLMAGVIYTGLVFSRVGVRLDRIPPAFWWALALAIGLTLINLALRWIRWAFLLRRSGHRVPVADSLTGYLSGLSLLFAPLLLGELAVRAAVHRARNGLPVVDVCTLNGWERLFDVLAMASIAAVASAMLGRWPESLVIVTLVAAAYLLRRATLSALVALMRAGVRLVGQHPEQVDPMTFAGALVPRVWLATFAVSVAAWLLPAVAMSIVVRSWTPWPSLLATVHVYV